MTVDEFAIALRGQGLEFISGGAYHNQLGRAGYRATYRHSGRYYWYSVSGTEISFAPDEVAAALTSPRRRVEREYPYRNSGGQQSFEATVRSGDHSFMLGVGPEPPRR